MRYKFFLLVLLGMLTAFGPFVTDMYVPSLPSMVGYFHTNMTMVQLGLTTSMLGLALGQLLFGPLSDKLGRRPPLLAAMLLFTATSVLIVFAPTIEVFVALRFVQGFAGAGGIVISRSVATDMFQGRELLKMLAVIGAINGIAPIAAPVVGGAIMGVGTWRDIFVVLLCVGVVLLVGSCFMRESLPVERRAKQSLLATFKLFGVVARNKRYMLYVLQQSAAQAILFGNIASSPFIVQNHYGLSPLAYSACFAANGTCIGIGAALSARFRKAERCVQVSCMGMLALSIAVAAVLWTGMDIWVYEAVLCVLLLFMGLTFTASTTLALNEGRNQAGTASALLGALGFLSGSMVSPLVGMGNILHSTAIVFVAGAVLSSIFAFAARPSKAKVN